MMLRGLNDRRMSMDFDGQVVQVVVVLEDDCLDGLRSGLAGFHVGRQDLVAELDLADRYSGAGGKQHLRGRGEAVITTRVDGIAGVFAEVGGVVCGECADVGCFGAVGEGVGAELGDVDCCERGGADAEAGLDEARLVGAYFVADGLGCAADEAEDAAVAGWLGPWFWFPAGCWPWGRGRRVVGRDVDVAVVLGAAADGCRVAVDVDVVGGGQPAGVGAGDGVAGGVAVGGECLADVGVEGGAPSPARGTYGTRTPGRAPAPARLPAAVSI